MTAIQAIAVFLLGGGLGAWLMYDLLQYGVIGRQEPPEGLQALNVASRIALAAEATAQELRQIANDVQAPASAGRGMSGGETPTSRSEDAATFRKSPDAR